MAKLSQADIKAKADEWAKLQKQIETATKTKEDFLAPLIAEHDARIDALQEKADNIESAVLEWHEKQPKAIRLEAKKAIAELQIKSVSTTGPRVIDVEQFIARAKKQKKNPWTCIKVEVGKAETLLGPKDINEVSSRTSFTTTKRDATLTLK